MPLMSEEKMVCPSSDPCLTSHNWGMWDSFDPMIAGSELVLGFSYSSDCQNLGCEVRRFAKRVFPEDVVVGIVKRDKGGKMLAIEEVG